MKLKRLGSVLLAGAIMATALTGCGGGSKTDDKSGGDSASGGKSTVTLWATGSDNVRSIFEKLTEDFNITVLLPGTFATVVAASSTFAMLTALRGFDSGTEVATGRLSRNFDAGPCFVASTPVSA